MGWFLINTLMKILNYISILLGKMCRLLTTKILQQLYYFLGKNTINYLNILLFVHSKIYLT